MELRERAIKEINNLSTNSLSTVYEVILSLKATDQQDRLVKKNRIKAYKKVRSLLDNIKGSLSDDITHMRQERI